LRDRLAPLVDEVVADTLSDLRRRYRAQLIMSSVARVAPDDDREGACDEPAGIGALLPGIAAIAEKDVPVDSATAERIRTYTALVTWADQVRSN
jgi:hypothetical protein